MNLQQVIYHDGNNNEFDYFVLKQKENVKIDKNSLAYQIDKTNDNTFTINQGGIQSNFDLILEVRLKNGEIKGTVPCNLEDVDLI